MHYSRSMGMAVGAAATVIILAASLIVSLVYVAFYAPNYSLFQKLVVIFVALVIAGTAVSVLWIGWAGRRGYIRRWS